MKKRYLFVAVVLLAAGLVLARCDLLELNEDTTGETGKTDWYTAPGMAEGKRVVVKFTSKEINKPQKDDKYQISYDGNLVSSGRIDVNGNPDAPTIIFNSTAGDQFQAVLDTSSSKLTFPKGIPTSSGIIMGYRPDGSNPPDPVFETNLSSSATSLPVGESKTLSVTANANNGGTPLYYQWYRNTEDNTNGTAIVGATGPSYIVPSTTAGTFYYYVKVGNATGGVNTSQRQKVIVIATEIVVGNSSGMTPLHNLKDAIETLLSANGNKTMAYSVNFAEDLTIPLEINDYSFPGGKLTIKQKSGVTFTKGLYITRSNVELNGLKIEITDTSNAALYSAGSITPLPVPFEKTPCAILISDRYFLGFNKPVDPIVKNYTEFKNYKGINGVSIVGCDIVFRAHNKDSDTSITGIFIDPYTTASQSSIRVKITGTRVAVESWGSAGLPGQCFMGNNADFSANQFTSNGTRDRVAYILFPFKLVYDDYDPDKTTITFAMNNRFSSSTPPVFIIGVNRADKVYTNDHNIMDSTDKVLEKIGDDYVCPTFGLPGHEFKDLPEKYRWFIDNLFAQITNSPVREIYLLDFYTSYTIIDLPPSSTPLDDDDQSWCERYTRDNNDTIARRDVWPADLAHL